MAIIGVGAKIQVDISGTYTDIAEVVSIGGPDITVGDVDVTHLQSANAAKEFIAGLLDGGAVTMEANFTAAQYNTLYGFARSTKSWRITLSNGSKFDFSGHWNALGMQNPLEEEVQMPFTIKVTGKPTFTS